MVTDDLRRISVSVTAAGVQLVIDNHGKGPVRSYEPGEDLWPFLTERAARLFANVPQVRGLVLVRVDMTVKESQFSYKEQG